MHETSPRSKQPDLERNRVSGQLSANETEGRRETNGAVCESVAERLRLCCLDLLITRATLEKFSPLFEPFQFLLRVHQAADARKHGQEKVNPLQQIRDGLMMMMMMMNE